MAVWFKAVCKDSRNPHHETFFVLTQPRRDLLYLLIEDFKRRTRCTEVQLIKLKDKPVVR